MSKISNQHDKLSKPKIIKRKLAHGVTSNNHGKIVLTHESINQR